MASGREGSMMTRYMPILKGKRGELDALKNSPSFKSGAVYPVLEIVPKGGGEVKTFISDAVKRLPSGSTVAVDTTYLPLVSSNASPLRMIADDFDRAGISVVPVVREFSSTQHLADASYAVSLHSSGAVLRLGDGSRGLSSVAPLRMREILKGVGTTITDLDVILDFRVVDSQEDVAEAGKRIAVVGPWANGLGARSVIAASGAFPQVVSNLALGTSTPLRRFDADFWQAHAAGMGFGDYAVNHPCMPKGGARGPKPNLRYTVDHVWHVWREDTNDPKYPANKGFFALCRKVVHDPSYAGSGHCWGDAEVDRCGNTPGTAVSGMGTATEWRAYGTSHHIETVVSRLATLGAP